MPFWPLCCDKESFVPVTGLQFSYGEIFIPVIEISVAKTDISVTGPGRPLIWTLSILLQKKSVEARSSPVDQPHEYPSFNLSWKLVEGWSKTEKQSAEHKADNVQNFADIWKCEKLITG